MTVDIDALRAEFVRMLTVDSETKDRRRKEFNQAIFNADEGWAIWSSTDLEMVMSKFDKAVWSVKRADLDAARRRRDIFDIDHMSMDDD